jgi:hypothetical protein
MSKTEFIFHSAANGPHAYEFTKGVTHFGTFKGSSGPLTYPKLLHLDTGKLTGVPDQC